MATNEQKTPLGRSLNRWAGRAISNLMQLSGKAIPASVVAVNGSIVTVKFEILSIFTLPTVTCPLLGAEYIRLPIQAGCKGFVIPADFYLYGVDGLGTGTADATKPANLAALVFAPVGNKNWFSVLANVLTMYGPDGVTLMTQDESSTMQLTGSGTTFNLNVTIGGIGYLQHVHEDPQGGVTGPPQNP